MKNKVNIRTFKIVNVGKWASVLGAEPLNNSLVFQEKWNPKRNKEEKISTWKMTIRERRKRKKSRRVQGKGSSLWSCLLKPNTLRLEEIAGASALGSPSCTIDGT